MEKHIVDKKSGIGYTLQGDYYIPDLTLPPEADCRPIGVWGMRHKCYLMERMKTIFTIISMNNTLRMHLADINEQAEKMFTRIVNEMAKAEGITEQLKVADQMAWVGAMNSIRSRAKEIVNLELIYV